MATSNNRNWLETLAVNNISPNTYATMHPPERMGNSLPIAYGGFALAVAVKTAYLSLPTPNPSSPPYHLYSLLGSFLGPAQTDRPLLSTSTAIRKTRTFCTFQISISQRQNDGSTRLCLIALADFQIAEPASLLEYSVSPSKAYSKWQDLSDGPAQTEKAIQEGRISKELAEKHDKTFGLMDRLFELRPCPEGIFPQVLTGMAKHLPTTQDDLPMTQRSTADWLRSRTSLPDDMDNVSLLAFFMDSALGFAPLAFTHMFLEDSGAASTLDFALRVFKNGVDLSRWHLREITTGVGAEARTFNEARMWDDGGVCVASMTQQCICRPQKVGKGKL